MAKHALSAKDIAADVGILDRYEASVIFIYDSLFDNTGEHSAFAAKALYKRGWRLAGMVGANQAINLMPTVYLYMVFEREPVKRQSIADKLKSGIE